MPESPVYKIEVAPRSIPISNTGKYPLEIVKGKDVILLNVGAAAVITPGDYQVVAILVVPDHSHGGHGHGHDHGHDHPTKKVVIATICYGPHKFSVVPSEHQVPGGQFGVYVNLLDFA